MFKLYPNSPPSRTRPEVQLLIACARTTIDSETAGQIKALLQEELDWPYIVDKARRHFVTPLLYKSLSNRCLDNVPKEVLSQLQKYCQEHTRYNLYLTQELLSLLRLLDANSIPALPLKGPILAVLAYGSISLRQFADLDILIHQKDLLKALNLFFTRGYRWAVPMTRIQKMAPRFSQRKDIVLTDASGTVRVELHWRLTGNHFSFPVNKTQLWNRLEPMQIGGTTVYNLPLNDLLLFLCMHGARHGWERLEWICDIAELVQIHPALNWKQLLREARALGNERNLALGLFLAKDLLGAKLPLEVLQGIKADPVVESLASQIKELIFSNLDTSLDIADWHDYHLLVRERLRDKIRLRLYYYKRYLHLAIAPTVRERNLFPLPAYLSFLYYIVRPIRLTQKYGLRALKRLLKTAKS